MSFKEEIEEEESFDHTLLVVREVSVFKIPPRSSSGGYKCGQWLQSNKIWSGRLRVVSCKQRCEIRLEDPNSGELFATCLVYPGTRDSSVETTLDSSRYFVLKIENGRGKHAFIGLGFNERNEAFDFNVALSDHDKYVKRKKEDEESTDHIDIHPAVNHRLKEGETIRINVKNKPISNGTGMISAAGTVKHNKPLGLAPPPPPSKGFVKTRYPLLPPPNVVHPVSRKISNGVNPQKESSRNSNDHAFSDFSQLGKNLPSSAGSGAAEWTAF
ncbi:uncharacterized protein At1g03900-like [Impatiens glandulifera]|uniref:uncharacterized protein At1g03900-like n=1 Tax=Impatiens glandulifera TaxID=253017 RepID=UPI001FB0964B|nr:uncharacterized protein At1g03900-like [Impatiens glandulifera]